MLRNPRAVKAVDHPDALYESLRSKLILPENFGSEPIHHKER
jgi:hypothetical protein